MPLDELRARRCRPTPPGASVLALDCAKRQPHGRRRRTLLTSAARRSTSTTTTTTRASGTINLVVADASSTGEIVRDLLAELGRAARRRDRRAALRRARHGHRPLPVHEHDARSRCAWPPSCSRPASTCSASSDASTSRSSSRSSSCSRGRSSDAQVYDGGRLVISYLPRSGLRTRSAPREPYSEGIIDYLRAVEGAELAALIREPPRAARRAAARSACAPRRDGLDVSAIARASAAAAGTGRPRASRATGVDRGDHRLHPSRVRGRDLAGRLQRVPECRRAGSSRPASSSSTSLPAVLRSPSSRELRRRTGARTGHAGTLDPFATGLLLVLLGRATRLARYLRGARQALPDGDRPDGAHRRPAIRKARARGATRRRTPQELEGRLAGLRGEIELPIPAASAVKIGGERAYRLHRRGVAVEMPLRRSRVDELDVSPIRTASPASTCASPPARTSARSPTRSAATAGRSAAPRSARSPWRRPIRVTDESSRTRSPACPSRCPQSDGRPCPGGARGPPARGGSRHLRRCPRRPPADPARRGRRRAHPDGRHLRPAPACRRSATGSSC